MVLDILTLFFSLVALIVSLCIAYKQNKVSLFDKRYEIYKEFCRLLTAGRNLASRDSLTVSEALQLIMPLLNYSEDADLIAQFFEKTDTILNQTSFLFQRLTREQQDALSTLKSTFYSLLLEIADSEQADVLSAEKLADFLNACNSVGQPNSAGESGVIAQMERVLRLDK